MDAQPDFEATITDPNVNPQLRAHPTTPKVFILALVGLAGSVLAGIGVVFGGWAWYLGNRTLRQYDAEPGHWGHRRRVEAGRTMAIIATAVSATFAFSYTAVLLFGWE